MAWDAWGKNSRARALTGPEGFSTLPIDPRGREGGSGSGSGSLVANLITLLRVLLLFVVVGVWALDTLAGAAVAALFYRSSKLEIKAQ